MAPSPSRLPIDADFTTIRGAARRARIGERVIRGAVRRGEIALISPPGAWPRVAWADVVSWLRAQRAPATTSHAEARVREVLDREAARGAP